MAHVTICGPNLIDQSKGDFHVHSADCGDLRNYGPGTRYGGDAPATIDAVTYRDVVRFVYPPEDFGYDEDTELDDYAGEFHFAPCCSL